MIRVAFVAGTFTTVLALLIIARVTGSTQAAAQRPAPLTLEQEIKRVEAEIDKTFAGTLEQLPSIPAGPEHRMKRVQTLGKLELFDKQLSVNRNTACTFCHMPDVDFTGPISLLNATTVAYPGSVRNVSADPAHSRYGHRKPQSYTYAPYYPALQYNQTQGDFYGGNFWDLRATGYKLQNPAAEQAQGPPVDPNEMGFPDTACVVHRLSVSPYRSFFEAVWGAQSFAITWPSDIESVCSTPGPAKPSDPLPVHLSRADRGRSNATYDQFALAIAAYEASPDVSPFSSKFDYAIAHADQKILSADEQAGWDLFHGKAMCNTCHLDGTESLAGNTVRSSITPAGVGSKVPLFTDFTSANIGVPRNLAIPYYGEDKPDKYGFISNPLGLGFVDKGVGAFLRDPTLNPNSDWVKLAPQFDGKFQVSTLRNVDMRPRPDFVKAYTHNGYFKSLKEIVHFYNTRDKLPRCQPGTPGEKVICWPPPEVPQNMDTTIGNLGLTNEEEDQLIAFLKTLTDGYKGPPAYPRKAP
ncbi:MAG TPA: cytochrome c peroxidase [Pyrinomonadaceae bacterium]|jgi:cytochrome c peroxidase